MTAQQRPRFVLVTGAPGSGKSTLGRRLGAAARLPFIARDDVRGGLAHAAGAWTRPSIKMPTADEATERWFDTVVRLLTAGVSCVGEYVVRIGDDRQLDRLTQVADVVVIVTHHGDAMERLARRHRADRLVAQPAVLAAGGFADVDEHTAAAVARMADLVRQMRLDFDVPTLHVRTDDPEDPAFDEIIRFATGS